MNWPVNSHGNLELNLGVRIEVYSDSTTEESTTPFWNWRVQDWSKWHDSEGGAVVRGGYETATEAKEDALKYVLPLVQQQCVDMLDFFFLSKKESSVIGEL